MDYSFKVNYNEDYMKNYFKGASGIGIKDTLIVRLTNNGLKGWMPFKGSFKCLEEKSNIYFDNNLIAEEVYPNSSIEIVLNFSRVAKNKNYGNCFTTLQLVYKENSYNYITIRFNKPYDLLGNSIIGEGHIEKEEEEVPNYFNPQKMQEEIEQKQNEENNEGNKENEMKKIEEKKDDMNTIIKKFRSAFQFSKLDYPDDYLKQLLEKANNDFQQAMMIHIDLEDKKKDLYKKKVKEEDGLNSLVKEFRKAYQLSEQDYPDDVIKKALVKKEGNFDNAFEELMSFIE